MDTTPSPGTPRPAATWTPHSVAPEITTKGFDTGDGDFAAVIGGIIGAVVLLLICIIVLLWCLSRHKGSYVTNEKNGDDDDDDDMDDESVGSDAALQSREPLKAKEEE